MRRFIFGTLAVGLTLLVLLIAFIRTPELSPEILMDRCATARPEWTSYAEDIKGMIGAGPVAQWRGDLHQAVRAGRELRLNFRLAPPWAEYTAAIPILLRDPQGQVHYPREVKGDNAERTYLYRLPPESTEALPWIEVHYPGVERRISFDREGRWRAAS